MLYRGARGVIMPKKDLGDVGTLLGDLVREVPVVGWGVVAGLVAGLVAAIALGPPFNSTLLASGLTLAGGFLGLVVGVVLDPAVQHLRGLAKKARRKPRRRRRRGSTPGGPEPL
jgi:hypothetical protein